MKLKPGNNDRTLESLKVFPYVAWALTLGFAFFVYNITLDLKEVTENLQVQTEYLQQQVNTPIEKIEVSDSKTTAMQ